MEKRKKAISVVEIAIPVSEDGEIVISSDLVQAMNFRRGENVYFTYLTESSGIENYEKTLVVTPTKIDGIEELFEEEIENKEIPEEVYTICKCLGIEAKTVDFILKGE